MQQVAGRAPRPGHERSWLCARTGAAICFRVSCCLRVSSIHRRFLQGPRPTHERSETARCAARAPPRRRFGARARETRFCESRAFTPKNFWDASRRRRGYDVDIQSGYLRRVSRARISAADGARRRGRKPHAWKNDTRTSSADLGVERQESRHRRGGLARLAALSAPLASSSGYVVL